MRFSVWTVPSLRPCSRSWSVLVESREVVHPQEGTTFQPSAPAREG
jgi:hypothetical protein